MNEHGERAKVARMLKKPEHRRLFGTKIHGGPYQRAGLPDWAFLFQKGRDSSFDEDNHPVTLFVEMKSPGGTVTKLQRLTFDEIRRAGGNVVVCVTAEEVFSALKLHGYQAEKKS